MFGLLRGWLLELKIELSLLSLRLRLYLCQCLHVCLGLDLYLSLVVGLWRKLGLVGRL